MNRSNLRQVFGAALALVIATLAFAAPPTPQEALDYAKSVVLLKRVVKDGQIHAYVKEVWRFDARDGTPPAVGSEYGQPMRAEAGNPRQERDGIAFKFGDDRPKGMTIGWTIPVMEDGKVPPFEMSVASVHKLVLKTNPKP